MPSFGILGQLFKIPPFSTQKSHSAGVGPRSAVIFQENATKIVAYLSWSSVARTSHGPIKSFECYEKSDIGIN